MSFGQREREREREKIRQVYIGLLAGMVGLRPFPAASFSRVLRAEDWGLDGLPGKSAYRHQACMFCLQTLALEPWLCGRCPLHICVHSCTHLRMYASVCASVLAGSFPAHPLWCSPADAGHLGNRNRIPCTATWASPPVSASELLFKCWGLSFFR